ncbi:MAG: pyridoxal phosphate-dependent aminotransferase [Acidobacteriota bacterium]
MSAPKLSLSGRSECIAKAEIRTMTVECAKVGGVNLAQGVCDMAVPEPVIDGAWQAMKQGVNSYTRHDGLAVLREAIARKMLEYNGITADPETEVVVSAGSTGALYCACMALLDPGDEVILFEPYYGYHLSTLLAVDAVPRFVSMRPPDWDYSLEDLERAVGPRTKAILLNTPGNPTGKVYTQEELRGIADTALKHDLFVLTDEIYEYFVYDGRSHISPGALPEIAERTITISGYSKTYSITGWRVGYCVCSARWAERIGHVNDLIYICAPAPLQAGVAAGIAGVSPDYYAELQRAFDRKRMRISDALHHAGFQFPLPQGAYYILADASYLPGRTSKQKAMFLLEETGVASVPGEAFYHDGAGENLLRFCYAKEDADLEEACRRLDRLRT